MKIKLVIVENDGAESVKTFDSAYDYRRGVEAAEQLIQLGLIHGAYNQYN